MKKVNLELKVGLFVILALAGLAWLVFKSGDFYLKPGYTVRLIFNFVSGVDKGTPVRLAGVNIGEVTAIYIVRNAAGESQVEVSARINQGALIEEDADVHISSNGLLGEKYIEILPGTSGKPTLAEGSTLPGRGPVGLEKLTESGNRLISKLESAVDNVNEVVGDPAFKSSVKKTFVNAAEVGDNLKETTGDLKDAMKSAKIVLGRLRDGEGTIGRLLKDDTIAKNLEAFSEDIKQHPWKLLKRN